MKRLKIGDILEIPTSKGFAYAQYTHENREYGSLIRVLEAKFNIRPTDFEQVARGTVQFVVFFPLKAAVKEGIFSIAANAQVPEQAKPFPIFRNGTPDPKTRKVANWWLWDGEKEWMIGALTEEQRSLPILGLCNDTWLVEQIESGWTAELDPR